MSDVPDVAGYVLTSGPGDVVSDPSGLAHWQAVEEETRRRVTLVPLPAMSPAERERVSGALAPFADVSNEHLREPARLAERADALVVPAAEYVSLDRLMPAVRPSSAGQVVTVVAPVAAAVAALADAGLAHGGVGEHVVSIDADGRPRLMRAGVLSAIHALSPGDVREPTPQADRDAVLTLLRQLADAVVDDELDDLVGLLAAQHAGPAEVAERLLTQFEPVPLGQQEADPASSSDDAGSSRATGATTRRGTTGTGRRAPRRKGARRALLAAVASTAAVVAVGVLWSASSDDGDPAAAGGTRTDLPAPAAPNAAAPSPPAAGVAASADAAPDDEADDAADGDAGQAVSSLGTDLCGAPGPPPEELPAIAENWADVIDDLNTRRSAALVTGQVSLLCEVYDPLSPGLVSDLELDAAYADRGVRPDSLVFVVEQAVLVEQDGALLVLEITDRLEPYALLAQDGRVVAELPGIGSEPWQARLVPDATGTQWRFG